MYIERDDLVIWPKHGISMPAKYLPILQYKAAGWSWKCITTAFWKENAATKPNPSRSRDFIHRYFQNLPDFKCSPTFTTWLRANGVQPSEEELPRYDNGRGIIYCFAIPEHPRIVKIGMAYEHTLKGRFQTFSTSYPKTANRKNSLLAIEWTVPAMAQAYEKRLHSEFNDARLPDCEWFYLQPSVINWIKRCNPDALLEGHQLLTRSQQALYQPILL